MVKQHSFSIHYIRQDSLHGPPSPLPMYRLPAATESKQATTLNRLRSIDVALHAHNLKRMLLMIYNYTLFIITTHNIISSPLQTCCSMRRGCVEL